MGKRFIGSLIFLFAMPSFTQADSIVRVGACKTAYHPKSLIVRDSLLYLADGGSFVVIDVSNPASPWVRSVLEDIITDRAEIVTTNLFVKDTLVYIRSNVFLTIVSVANPDSCEIIGYTGDLPNVSHERGMFISDTIAFLPCNIAGVWMCNVADPTNPTIIDTSFPTYCAINLTMRDSILFIADGDSVLIVNAKDPMNLQRISSVPTLEHVSGGALYDVAVQGNYAYFTASWYYSPGKLGIVDISDLKNPEIIGEVRGLKGGPEAIYLENEYAYIATVNQYDPFVKGGIRVVDIENPDSASRTVSYDTPGSPKDIYVVGDLIYVADYDSVLILRHIRSGIEEREKLKLQSVELKVYPSPFKRQVAIEFTVPFSANACLEIYDAVGRKVRTLYNGILWHTTFKFYWNGKDDYGKEVAVGKYFVAFTPEGLWAPTGEEIIYLK
ncbi:hypothetical protein KAW50_06470 [candidate division WOR-3 bacterium]|nr:hypothetical protein [candidate division WOR-3 bacterium]